jgi:hypothetical protein
MPGLLYTIYAVTVLLVAVGGLLAVTFGTPGADGRADRRYQALSVLGALFVLAIVGSFLL